MRPRQSAGEPEEESCPWTSGKEKWPSTRNGVNAQQKLKHMARPDHLGIIAQGIDAWRDWRAANRSTCPDRRRGALSGANLSEADLREANLSATNLSEADLRGADLSRANLTGANLNGADISKADLA